jgi:DNA processing protein
VLYYRGTADLNQTRVINIVGTRRSTPYGEDLIRQFITDLQQWCPQVLVVSGLAYGVDICAHRHALENGYETVGVLAHGLDQIYPRMHRATAIEMLRQGGLLTEFMSQSVADKINFVARNRIVAGMADATLVVESAEKGGSLITTGIAEGYGRDVFAVPGRVGDKASAGCNLLIRDNRAVLLQSAEEFVEAMGWATAKKESEPVQRELFPELSPDEMAVFEALKDSDGKHLNMLTVETNIPIGQLSSILFEMELRGIVRLLSGGMYKLV